MNLLLSVVRNIALLVLISSFWELLAPRGSLRGMVRLVMGLLLVSCVVLPLCDALSKGSPTWHLEYEEESGVEQSLAAGQRISRQIEDEARKQYESEMARQVASLCLLSEGVSEAKAAVWAEGSQGALERVSIEAKLKPGAEPAEVKSKLTTVVSTFFAIQEQSVDCQIKEVTDHEGATAAEPKG